MFWPRVSIIVPCHNQGKFLPTAIDSLLSQTYAHREIIVVNDGSDDTTEARLSPYARDVRYLRQPQAGVAAARNNGVAASTGEYLLFLDADDYLHPEALSWLLTGAAAAPARLQLMGWHNCDADRDFQPGAAVLPPRMDVLLPALLYANFAPPLCYLCPRTLFEQVNGFDPNLSTLADWDLWLRIALVEPRVQVIQQAGAYYRRYPQSMSEDRQLAFRDNLRLSAKAGQTILTDPHLLANYAHDVYRVLIYNYRCLIARGIFDADFERIGTLCEALRRQGVRLPGTSRKRLADSLLGLWGEFLFVYYMRLFRPLLYRGFLTY